MNENEPIIASFKDIMDNFFYDWGMTQGVQIHKEIDGYWINKTFLDENKLTYKMSYYEVELAAWLDFQFFYENLYKDDPAFWRVMDLIEDEWHQNKKIEKTSHGYKIGKLSISENAGACSLESDKIKENVSQETFSKIKIFIKLMNN